MSTVTLPLGPGAELHLNMSQAKQAWAVLAEHFGTTVSESSQAYVPDGPVLDVDHAMWSSAVPGTAHKDPAWSASDSDLALAFYAALHGKAKQFLDLLIDHPGRLIATTDFDLAFPGSFPTSYAVAGAINGLRKPREAAGRRYPFSYWQTEGAPTRYAIHPEVAAIFGTAREALR